MSRAVVHLLVLMTLSCQFTAEEKDAIISCGGNQKAFRGSCFEFVGLRRSFFSAQAWCEGRGGGHLAFIIDEDTQNFFQRHLDPEEDSWFGVAASASASQGPLAWLDGSPLSFSKWASRPLVGAACGHVLGNSGFQWEATKNCSQKRPFICQFEKGRSIVCTGYNTSLQCGSGQVLMIDGSFYGQNNPHYCRPRVPAAQNTLRNCGWKDVVQAVAAHCGGQQLCHISDLINSFAERCHDARSYLSVDSHCEDRLRVSVNTTAAVSHEIPIRVKLLAHLSEKSVNCKLSMGDGRVFYLQGKHGLESSILHTYTQPSRFIVAVECTSGEIHSTVQKIITIQEAVAEIGVIRCYAGRLSFPGTNCKALSGAALQFQMEGIVGTNVTYRIQREQTLLSGFSVLRGNIPHNITVSGKMVKELGPGCHNLTLYASNRVTFPEVSTNMQVCIFEKIAGLQASLITDRDACSSPADVTFGVSVERGAPVLLLFSVFVNNSSLSEIREMTSHRGTFHMEHPIQGPAKVKLKAWNDFSFQEVDLDELASCDKNSVGERTHHIRVVRSSMEIVADPSNVIKSRTQEIELSIKDTSKLKEDKYTYEWHSEQGPNKCHGPHSGITHTIEEDCLPEPFEYFKYHFEEIDEKDKVKDTESICITLTPKVYTGIPASFICFAGCNPVIDGQDAKIKCVSCTNLIWNIENPYDEKDWSVQDETKSCYKDTRPLIERQDGGIEYTVKHPFLAKAKSKSRDIKVVVFGRGDTPSYTTFIIETSSTDPTTKGPATTKATTVATTAANGATTAANGATTAANGATTAANGATTAANGATTAANGATTVPTTISTIMTTRASASTTTTTSTASTVATTATVMTPTAKTSATMSTTAATAAKTSVTVARTTASTATTQVQETTTSICDLQTELEGVVAEMKTQGQLSGESLGRAVLPMADKLNSQSDPSQKADRQKVREFMLGLMIDVAKEAPASTPQEVRVIAVGLGAVLQEDSELSMAAQEDASSFFATLSSSLLQMNSNINDKEEIDTAASNILELVGKSMDYSFNRNISDFLLVSINNILSALLMFKGTNEPPTIIQQNHISVLVQRVTPEKLNSESMKIPNCSCSGFSLPPLASKISPSEDSVDVRMMSLDKNPFSWNEGGDISGSVGALSLTARDGSGIPVENLSEDVEILLPRPAGEQVNTSVLDLGNYSTTAIDVPSANTTLLLKMVPSKDPLPFKVFLSYMEYPTDTNFVAVTEMPHQGSTLEERYTWLLDPESLKGNIGTHYLVVRPIVGPGIKSINATLSITPITASCKFWNESLLDWSNDGCRVGVNTTPSVTQCLCNHLTFFGSSFFVAPNLVDPSRTAELFANFAENPVVVCFVGALFIAYLLVVVWARRKDVKDTAKVKVTVLPDNNPMDQYYYLLSISTGHRIGAATSSQVTVTLLGADGNSEPHHLTDPKKSVFERGAMDLFLLSTPFSLGDLQSIRLWHNNSGNHPAWYVGNVVVQDLQTKQKWYFLCNSWLSVDMEDCCLDKTFPVSTEADLKRFSNLFFMKTTKDFNDGHLWFSVVNRPPSSTFTCVQRVSCCFSLLLCTMLTSIMFYGIPTDPSEQTLDLGHFEFTWQQFMVGVQSSLIMFPVNILIVSIFRSTRPRETPCCRREKSNAFVRDVNSQAASSPTAPTNTNANITLDNIIKDITRIAHLLSRTVKSNIPSTESEFGPGKKNDINAILSVVEDFIKQNNKPSETTASKTQPQLPEMGPGVHPVTTEEAIEKKSNKTQYLYKQLCHIEKELVLLGASSFPSSQSFSQALQQVQRMKAFLQDQLFNTNSINVEESPLKKSSPADSTDADGSQKKRRCCHGGLPWWFVFVGWFLVAGTSVISGYFTMLYGLKFGKERSISWLVSMIVSFFQSLLLIQPLKVLCIAVFFAVVIKNVDEEDVRNVDIARKDQDLADELQNQQTTQRDSSLYEPPPPADVEKMRKYKIMESKAFALLREILMYFGFMWMLLLVAYGQRDPNAFFLNQHIRKSFLGNMPVSLSLGDVFTWANTTLLSNLFGVYPGFITDGNSKLVGNARLRHLRVQKSSCQIAGSMLKLIPDCLAPYSWDTEDMGSYEPGWNQSMLDNSSMSAPSPWTYQTQAQLRSYPIWGNLVVYRGGGFVAELGPDLHNASSTLEYLFSNTWLNMYTRAVFVEFTVYNANVNLFCIVTLLLETAAVGAFQFHSELQTVRLYQSTGGLHIFVMAAEIIYIFFILYYIVLQGKLMKQQRWAYFRNKWNLLELTIILLSLSAVAVFTKRTLLGNRDITYYQNHKDQFASFYETATADSVLQYLIAFLVLLATVKLWHLLRLNPKMNTISSTLQRAWSDISSFLVVIVIMLLAYSITSNVLYGWKLSSYRTLTEALLTVISLQIGMFNYDEVLSNDSLLGGLLFGSCTVFVSYVVINLLISVILVAFKEEQIHHKPSEEEEVVDLMLTKICGLFGIRYQDVKDQPQPEEK